MPSAVVRPTPGSPTQLEAGTATRPSGAFTPFAWGILAYTVLVALWGAFVRATGSGAGCGSHWPLCNGEVVPRSPTAETWIELTHRVTSGAIGLLMIALAVWAVRRFGLRHRVALAALATLALTIVEGLLGAGLVRFELVADNASMTRAVVMAIHLVNTFLLMAAMTLTAAWSARADRRETSAPVPRDTSGRPRRQRLAAALGLALLTLAVLGASGAITALGDTLFPVASLTDEAFAALPATAQVLVELRILHPWLALAVGAQLALTLAYAWRRRPAGSRRLARLILATGGIYALQLGLGLLNIVLAAPVWMQLVHLGFAYLLWIGLVLVTEESLTPSGESGSAAMARPR